MDPLDDYNASVNRRLSIAAFLTVALGIGAVALVACAGSESRVERARFVIQAAQGACSEYMRGEIPRFDEAEELCPLLVGPPAAPHPAESDDGPVSGDSGPAPDGGPGQGERRVP
jgi:hypothetical protein